MLRKRNEKAEEILANFFDFQWKRAFAVNKKDMLRFGNEPDRLLQKKLHLSP